MNANRCARQIRKNERNNGQQSTPFYTSPYQTPQNVLEPTHTFIEQNTTWKLQPTKPKSKAVSVFAFVFTLQITVFQGVCWLIEGYA